MSTEHDPQFQECKDSQPNKKRLLGWFFEGLSEKPNMVRAQEDTWWKVLCLTGVDYFSTIGYQPGIAFLAAGILSPIATLVVVLITLFGLIPLYREVAKSSPNGLGSIGMLEDLLHGWKGKAFILVLLGFAATDFVITITLSAADATAHIIENPIVSPWLNNKVGITLFLLLVLGAIFLKGFREAIGLAVFIVFVYLICNCIVLARCVYEVVNHPEVLSTWYANLFVAYHSLPQMIALSVIFFPKLALGMSGFETGVAVMPLVKGDPGDSPESPFGRIRNTNKLLVTSASIMAVALLISAVVTTVLIPPAMFAEGGQANGRALAYLAHHYMGSVYGTIYDVSTILILWFAGASAMAGLLTLVPRYLPRYGMAPDWARAQRPLVIVLTVITLFVTIVFRADVSAQAGAYATGMLVLFTSAALAVAIHTWQESFKRRICFVAILVLFIYTTIANMIERPEGLHIASIFIGVILLVSLISRTVRSLELRISSVHLDETAQKFLKETMKTSGKVCLLAHREGTTNYAEKEAETRAIHKLTPEEASFLFLEVEVVDPSDFKDEVLDLWGHEIDGYRILRCQSLAVPNAIAATLLYLQARTNTMTQAYCGWREGHPMGNVFKYIFLGEGETASLTREILREAEPDPEKRPRIIVG